MTIIVRDVGSVPRTLTGISVLDEDSNLQEITEIWVRDSNNVPRLVFSSGTPLSVSVVPDIIGGIAYGSGVVTTSTTEAIPAGGVAPYTYAWTVLSHTNATPPVANSPAAAITDFTQVDVITEDSAEFRVTVTDDVSATATADVSAFFQNVTFP